MAEVRNALSAGPKLRPPTANDIWPQADVTTRAVTALGSRLQDGRRGRNYLRRNLFPN